MEEIYSFDWKPEDIHAEVYAHRVMNYRYHWHDDEYELDLVVKGKAQFHCDGRSYVLEPGDILLINPGIGHASLALDPGTVSLVLRFNTALFRQYLGDGKIFYFKESCSDDASRSESQFRKLRYGCVSMLQSAHRNDCFTDLEVKAALGFIASVLCREFSPEAGNKIMDNDPDVIRIFRKISDYIEKNYMNKITLEEMADYVQYNRTYFSTFFKKHIGIGFYEYLTRIRFRNAVFELAQTDATLTSIALGNGFADLKSFNKRFKENFSMTPAEYRKLITPDFDVAEAVNRRYILEPDDPEIKDRLSEWLIL